MKCAYCGKICGPFFVEWRKIPFCNFECRAIYKREYAASMNWY